MHEDSRRQLGERFGAALDAPSDQPIDAHFAPGAAVFLQGASTPASPAAVSEYVRQLKRQGQFFHRVSKVYVTPTGFVWLLVVRRTTNSSEDDNAQSAQPGLWLEGTVQNDRITRVRIHFTVEALAAVRQPIEIYRAAAAARQVPLPADWENGTSAMLAAAERVDQQADNDSITTQTFFSVGALTAVILLAVEFAIRARRIWRQKPVSAGQRQDGRMLLRLRRARAAAGIVRRPA
jgi:hypothetical protein